MPDLYNVYCDESCHLENDGQPVMALGAIWCPNESVASISQEIAHLKHRYGADGELKWGKVSPAKFSFYQELVAWFSQRDDVRFRGLVVLDKTKLNHDAFNGGSHDDFYYKMYFSLLREILSADKRYEIYLDIKDTRSRKKVAKLRDVLCHDKYDFTSSMIGNLQNIRSHESHLLQLSDFFIGAITFKHRYILRHTQSKPSESKSKIVDLIETINRIDLSRSTSRDATKFNLFCFTPREVRK